MYFHGLNEPINDHYIEPLKVLGVCLVVGVGYWLYQIISSSDWMKKEGAGSGTDDKRSSRQDDISVINRVAKDIAIDLGNRMKKMPLLDRLEVTTCTKSTIEESNPTNESSLTKNEKAQGSRIDPNITSKIQIRYYGFLSIMAVTAIGVAWAAQKTMLSLEKSHYFLCKGVVNGVAHRLTWPTPPCFQDNNGW